MEIIRLFFTDCERSDLDEKTDCFSTSICVDTLIFDELFIFRKFI